MSNNLVLHQSTTISLLVTDLKNNFNSCSVKKISEQKLLIRTVMRSTEYTAWCCSNAGIMHLTSTWSTYVHALFFAFLLSFVLRGHQLTDSSNKDYNCMSTHQNQKPKIWGTLGCSDSVSHRKTLITQYAKFHMQNLTRMYNFSMYYIKKEPLNSPPLFSLHSLYHKNSWPVSACQFWQDQFWQAISGHLLLLLLGPEHMSQMHRSHVGLLCYPRIIQVF